MAKLSLEAISSSAIGIGILLAVGNQYMYIGNLSSYEAVLFLSCSVMAVSFDIVCSGLYLSNHPAHNARRIKGLGLCYILLLPIANTLALCRDPIEYMSKLSVNCYISVMLFEVISHQVLCHITFNTQKATLCEYFTVFPWLGALLLHSAYVVVQMGAVVAFSLMLLCCLSLFFFWAVIDQTVYSLSLTEFSIIKQGLMIFVFHFSIWFYHSVWLDIGSGLSEIDVFLKVAVFSAIVVLFALYLFPSSWRKWLFYPVNVLVAGLVSYPILLQQLNANFVAWTCNLILGNLTHTALTFFWSLACFLCVSIVLNIVDIQKSSESGSHKYQVSSPVRKLFHLAVLIIFLPGFVTSVPLLRCSTTCACVVFGMIECARYLHVFPFTGAFNDHLEIFRDKQDQGLLILTPIYLLVGSTLPLWLSASNNACSIELYAGLISVGVGDAFASLVGCSYGHRKWPGSHRSIEGFVAYAMSCITVFLIFVAYCSESDMTYQEIVFVSMTCAVIESFTSHVDNLILPIFMFMLLV